MADAKVLVAVVLAVTTGMIFFPVVTDAVSTSTGTQTVTNETVTAETGEYVDLSGYSLEDGTVTVYGYNDTSDSYETASEGSDYEVKLDSGELKALDGSTLIDDGEEVQVSYDYQATDDMTTMVIGFVPVMIGLLLFVVLAQRVQRMV